MAAAPSAENLRIAQALRQAAELLQAEGANPFRVGAYRRAADSIGALDESVREIHATRGPAGLDALPGIGPGIAAAIGEMLETGRWRELARLRDELTPVQLLATIPGIGATLAQRIHESLGVTSLEGLEIAAHAGRLERVPGVGARRAASIRAAVSERLDRARLGRRDAPVGGAEPPVEVLLDVDREYRERALAGELERIAPRRFNPEGKAWLPVLHTTRGEWRFTALFSNTARAHELGRTHDWVVLYFDDGRHGERQRTVVSEHRGPQAGHRVVRGREAECRPASGAPRPVAVTP